MSNSYDYEYNVKYHQIYTELTHDYKIEKKELYSEQDIYSVCLEVYQQELLRVCNLTEKDDVSAIGLCLDIVWDDNIHDKHKNNERFKQLVLKYQHAYFKDLDINNKSYFGVLFNFDLFHITHCCLREYQQYGKITDKLLDEMEKCINDCDAIKPREKI